MAYTQDQINAAYATERANGASDADLQAIGASKYGVTGEQFNLASAAYAPAPSAAPAPAAAAAPTFGRFTQEQYDGAQQWADGKSAKEILGKAAELRLTSDELGYVFGEHGGSGAQVKAATQYDASNATLGSNTTGAVVPWGTDKSRALDDWRYDASNPNGWVYGKKSTGGGAPTTGINLSDLQGFTDWNVQPNETVRQQLQDLIAEDSPLMQQARARALQTANSRGLLNSSMAMTAADSAMYDAAMPIATQDASTFARAGEFNANTKNTFSRDNNQFVRDAYMADFNVQANDWAAEQQFDREYQMLDRQQQLTLERDAVQNGYTSARDQFAAGQQTIRDDKEAALRLILAQMDAASRPAQQPDTSVERLRMQLDMQNKSDTVSNLNALRSEYADKVFRINTSELSPEKADKAVMDLAATYNPMIASAASKLGYDPNSWIIKIEAPAAPAPATSQAAPAATTDAGSGG